jgi:hypothetical protein
MICLEDWLPRYPENVNAQISGLSSASRPVRRPSHTRAPRVDPIEKFSKQQLDLTQPQAFADQMTIELQPKQAAGIT